MDFGLHFQIIYYDLTLVGVPTKIHTLCYQIQPKYPTLFFCQCLNICLYTQQCENNCFCTKQCNINITDKNIHCSKKIKKTV